MFIATEWRVVENPAKIRTYILTLILLIILTCHCCAQSPRFVADSLDAYIRQGIDMLQIPGLAIAIGKDGKVIVLR